MRKQIEDLSREVEIERRKNERLQMEQRTNKDEMAVVIAAANAAAAATGTTAPSNLRCLRDTNVSVHTCPETQLLTSCRCETNFSLSLSLPETVEQSNEHAKWYSSTDSWPIVNNDDNNSNRQ